MDLSFDEMNDFDDEELLEILRGIEAIGKGDTISHEEVKRRLGYPADGIPDDESDYEDMSLKP